MMKTIGERLKEAREQKGVSINVAATETNISVDYIRALEENNFDFFPGETYITGFLKSYAEFLSLDSERTLLLYRNYKISEEPAPMAVLMKNPRKNFTALWLLIIFLLILIVVTATFLTPLISERGENHRERVMVEQEAIRSATNRLWLMDGKALEEIFNIGDRLGIGSDEGYYEFIYRAIKGKEITVEQWLPNKQQLVASFVLQLDDEKFFSLKNGNQADFLIKIIDIGLRGGEAVKFQFQHLNFIDSHVLSSTFVVTDEEASMISGSNLISRVEPSQMRISVLTIKNPVTVDVIFLFKGYSYFRYLLNGQEQNERYYQDGEQLQRTMKSNMRIWASNADKVRLKVGPNEVPLGKDGEVIVKELRWIRNSETGMWDLVLDNVN